MHLTPEVLRNLLEQAAIVPILTADDSRPATAVAVADALVEGGATVIEVLFRTPSAPAVLAAIRRRHPRVFLAAGTILNSYGASVALAAGADFTVSPGFSPALHAAAQAAGLPLVPGVNTAGEVQHARELGYLVQKFYPAWDHGHQRLPEFAAIYPDVTFLVTGALDSASVEEFARHSNVAALGGTWMLKSAATAAALAADRDRFRKARTGGRS
jgi:2-dehydro-3-deoxyphosphogluconate aldolase/(4S)-4-hydroxy-2-oxoglutarate aldolase